MTTDFRALCADLLWALENAIRVIYHEDGTKHISTANPIVNRARAALADEPAVPEGREPVAVTEQPSDQELLDIAASTIEPYECSGITTDEYEPETECAVEAYGSELIAFARAVLAHWGNHVPAPPADGEVAGLVEMLKGIAYWRLHGTDKPTPFDIRQAARLTRAADLLQRQVLPEVGE